LSGNRTQKLPEASSAAFREALAVLDDLTARGPSPGRPALSEVSIDPRFGFALILLEGGAELRLGRGEYSKKLARFDQILEAVEEEHLGGLSAVRVVNLDLGGRQVPVLLRGRDGDAAGRQAGLQAGQKLNRPKERRRASMARRSSDIIVGLDIGTTKIAALLRRWLKADSMSSASARIFRAG